MTIFATFSRRWPHLWAPVSNDRAGRRSWQEDLRRLGVTDETVTFGVERSAGLKFPPSPAEFAELCLPADLPTEDAAYTEAVILAGDHLSGGYTTPSHHTVWHAAVQTGLGRLANDAAGGRKAFSYNWQVTVGMYMRNEKLTEIPKALPRKSVVPLSAEEHAARLAYADERLASIGLGARAHQ